MREERGDWQAGREDWLVYFFVRQIRCLYSIERRGLFIEGIVEATGVVALDDPTALGEETSEEGRKCVLGAGEYPTSRGWCPGSLEGGRPKRGVESLSPPEMSPGQGGFSLWRVKRLKASEIVSWPAQGEFGDRYDRTRVWGSYRSSMSCND